MLTSLVVLATLQAPAVRPDTTIINPQVACPRCAVRRTKLVTLDPDYALVAGSIAISGEEVLLVPDVGDTQVRRFSLRTGKYLGLLGRSGTGPGEFGRPQFVANLPGDTVVVFDAATMRYSVLAPRSYRYVRGAAIQGGRPNAFALVPPAGTLWTSAVAGPANQVGYPLHRYAPDGSWLGSVGSAQPVLRWNRHTSFSRWLGVSPAGAVWVISRYGPLVIERYAATGDLLQVSAYRPSWLPTVAREAGPDDPPLAFRTLFWVASDRELWVPTLVADRDWRKGIIQMDDSPHGPNARARGDLARYLDSIVELFDVVAGRVVFRERVDEAVLAVLPGHRVVLYRESGGGTPIVTIEHWELRGRS